MDRLLFAAVADDDTGASDLAGMLAGQGVRTLLVIDLPPEELLLEWSQGYHAVVMAEATRNLKPSDAYERTRAAVRVLGPRRPHLFQVKYCSTFDSTPEGNIGPSVDAALDELGEEFTVAVPALPPTRRATARARPCVGHQVIMNRWPLPQRPSTHQPTWRPRCTFTRRRFTASSRSNFCDAIDGRSRRRPAPAG